MITVSEYRTRAAHQGSVRNPLGLLAVVCLLVLAGCSSGGSSGSSGAAGGGNDPVVKIEYGLVSKSASSLPVVLADAKGYFKKYNLNVDEIVTGASGKVCQQLIASSLDMGECSISDTAQTIAKGGSLVMPFFTSQSVLPNLFMANPDIKNWADMKGKTMMVAGPNDNTYYFTKMVMATHGLDITKDVQLLYAGSSTDRSSALFAGKVDAAILTAPYDYQATQKGYTQLDDLTKYLGPDKYTGGGVVTTPTYLKEHPDVVKRVYMAEEDALNYALDPANKDDVIKTIAGLGKSDQGTAQWIYDKLINSKYYFTGGKVVDSGIKGVLDSLVSLGFIDKGKVKPSDLYNYSVIGS